MVRLCCVTIFIFPNKWDTCIFYVSGKDIYANGKMMSHVYFPTGRLWAGDNFNFPFRLNSSMGFCALPTWGWFSFACTKKKKNKDETFLFSQWGLLLKTDHFRHSAAVMWPLKFHLNQMEIITFYSHTVLYFYQISSVTNFASVFY